MTDKGEPFTNICIATGTGETVSGNRPRKACWEASALQQSHDEDGLLLVENLIGLQSLLPTQSRKELSWPGSAGCIVFEVCLLTVSVIAV